MASNYLEPLTQVINPIPDDLQQYFLRLEANEDRYCSGRLGLFPPKTSAQQTESYQSFHPLCESLRMIALDDANTSNVHCYVPELPIPGSVFYLCHDGDSRIVFASLREYLDAADLALNSDGWITDYHSTTPLLSPHQPELNNLIKEVRDQADGSTVAPLIAASDLQDFALMAELAQDSDFYLGEAIAEQIQALRDISLLPLAEICAKHPHIQVNRRGKAAVKMLRSLN